MEHLDSILSVADRFDAVVLDQWGVLHDGTSPYPMAVACVDELALRLRVGVLSNSGKRADVNLWRIADMGFNADAFSTMMTSGEALFLDIERGTVPEKRFYPIERSPGDAASWAHGLTITLCDFSEAQAILLMGLPDGTDPKAFASVLNDARARGLPIYCTNPDRKSPRADGVTVMSPGALAHDYAQAGGTVHFYGKPHTPVFHAVERALRVSSDRVLMVGDSLEHDIAGAAAAGWSSLFIRGGLHAAAFRDAPLDQTVQSLSAAEKAPLPTYTLETLR